jgi:hypothetical protein
MRGSVVVRLAPVLALTWTGCGPGARDAVPDSGNGHSDATSVDGRGSDGSMLDDSRVYAHSGSELYRFNTVTLAPELVGTFTNLDPQSMTDLAIDKNDRMLGITLNTLFEIDPDTAATTLIKELSGSAQGFTSLSFVPVDPGNPDGAERLVAANGQGEVYEINTVTGNASLLGSYGSTAGGTISSSGDILSVDGFGLYATVDVGDDFSADDYLARIDPVTWRATPLGIGTGVNRIFGLGFWRGKIYGFVDNGAAAGTGTLLEIDAGSGAGTPLDTDSIRWFGAGVSTRAPIVE